MPWTEKQIRLFRAAAHDPDIAKRVGIPMGKAREMSEEGVKHESSEKAKRMAKALRMRKS